MHATTNVNVNNLHFVGDGCEVIACFATADEAVAEARRLNKEKSTTEYVSYIADTDETDDTGAFVFAAERIAAQEAGFLTHQRGVYYESLLAAGWRTPRFTGGEWEQVDEILTFIENEQSTPQRGHHLRPDGTMPFARLISPAGQELAMHLPPLTDE